MSRTVGSPRTLLSIAITLAMLVPSLFLGVASAASTGAQVFTDPAGDVANGGTAAADIVGLGATADATQVHFYLGVVNHLASGHPAMFDELDFTSGTLSYFTKTTYNANGSVTSGNVFTKAGVVGGAGKPITATWVGDELKVDINRADIGSPADGAQLTAISAVTYATATGGATYDSTSSGTYTVSPSTGGGSPTAPGAPSGLAGAAGNGQITLTWGAATDGGAATSSYKMYRGTASGAESLLSSGGCSGLGNVLTCTDTGLTNGQAYFYQVSAVNSVGEGAKSAEATATPAAGGGSGTGSTGTVIVTDPSGDVANGGTSAADITRLGASADATQIHLYTQVVNHLAAGHPAMFFETDFTAGTLSYFTKTTYNADGTLTPGSVFTKAGVVGGAGKAITASWVGDELKVDINRADIGSPADSSQLTAVSHLTWSTATGGPTYDSTSAGTYTITPGSAVSTVPAAPSGLAATAGNATITLSWVAPADGGSAMTGYQISRGASSGGETLLTTTSTAATNFADSGLTNGNTYFYKVAAVNAVGTGPQSNEASATPTASAPPAETLSFTNYPGPAGASATGADHGGEPSIGIDHKTGNVLVTGTWYVNQQSLLRVAFDDTKSPPTATWTPVPALQGLTGTIDAILSTDSLVGRTWAGGILHGCSLLYISDDDGQTWIPTADNCALPAVDHETVQAVPYHAGTTNLSNPTYPNALYYCAQTAVTQCARSDDGGVTFGPGVVAPCGGIHGHMHGSRDGTIYLPIKSCGSGQALMISQDNGVTWTSTILPGSSTPGAGSDPSVGAGRGDKVPGGRVYVATQDGNDHPLVYTSANHGATFGAATDLAIGAAAGLRASVFPAVTVGDDDRAAVQFLGTKDAGSPFSAAFTGVWHLYMAVTYDAGATWTVTDATPVDPVQRGWICLGGTGCAGGRNLLDFNGMEMDAKGRPLAVWADGCIATCSGASGTSAQSTNSLVTITRLSTGRGLLSQFDPTGPAALSVSTTGPYSGLFSSAIGVAATVTGGTSPYTFAWSVTNSPAGSTGGSFANANAAVTSFTADAAGLYSLKMTVRDAAGGIAIATTSLTATVPATVGCQSGGVTIASDATNDGGTAGDASEVYCLRASDDPNTINFYYDVKGHGVGSGVGSGTPLLFDLLFSDKNLAGGQTDNATSASPIGEIQAFEIETTYDGASFSTREYSYLTGLGIQGQTFTTEWIGNTIHIAWARTSPGSPANGDTLESMQLVAQQCTTTACSVKDKVPNAAPLGAYAVGGSSTSGTGKYYPECGESLGTDAAGDVSPGSHDLTKFAGSDNATHVKFCWSVSDITQRPSAEASYIAFFSAPYQAPGAAYAVNVAMNTDGSIDAANSGWASGACDPANTVGCASGITSGPAVDIKVVENTIIATFLKSDIGAPADGTSTGPISVDVRDLSDSSGTAVFDRIAATTFKFGQKVDDAVPPSQVTGLTVTDPQTGTALSLTWTAATDNIGVTQYDVMRSTTSGSGYTRVGTPTGTSFTSSGLTQGTTYYFVVKAEDAAANVGPASAEASGTPTYVAPPDTTPPSVPTNLVACGTTTSSICISWSASSDPQSGVKQYNVFRSSALVGSPTLTTFTDSSLAANTTYTYTVSAVNGVNLESAKSSPLAVRTLGFTGPTIRVTSPTNGASVLAPLTISGDYSTTGQPVQYSAQPFDTTLPWQTTDWASSAFVQLSLRSSELATVRSQVSALDGYLSIYPTSDGKLQVLLAGAKPLNAPTQSPNQHWPIVYAENVKVTLLSATTPNLPQHIVTLDDIRNGRADAAPTGPSVPGIVSGIGPGTAIRMHDPVDGQTYICTASYLFENPATGKYYLETAGHCLIDSTTATDGVATPSAKADKVFLCYLNCIDNYIGAGTYIELDRTSTYEPVAYTHQSGVGNDAGFIEIPPEVNQYLKPWMNFWSGPTAAPTTMPQTGDLLVHYGFGVGSGAVFPTQGRAAITVSDDGSAINALGYIWNGDSGSSIGRGQPDQARLVTGGPAAGIITHALGVGTPAGSPGNVFYATDFNRALDMAQPVLGFRPVLVTQSATIRLPGAVTTSLAASIASPAEGSTSTLGSAVAAAGTATFPSAVTAGTGNTTYYMRQDAPPPSSTACGALSLTLTLDNVSRGCGSLAGPVGPAWELVLGPNFFEYDSASLTSPMFVDPTRPITAQIFVKGQGATPVLLDMELQLAFGSTLVGSQRVTQTAAPSTTTTEFDFSFPALVNTIPAGQALKWKVITHLAEGPAFIYSGGATPSKLTIPLGVVPTQSVDLSLDDATFGTASAIPTSGTTAWTATVPASALTFGSHTLYARATQGATSSAATLVHINVAGGNHTAPTASFTVSTTQLAATFTDTSTPGDSAIVSQAWNFGDGVTGSGASVTHTYAVDGTYTVTLTVTDANTLTGTTSKSVQVAATHTWSIDVRVSNAGGDVLPATIVQAVADGSTGSWSYFWNATPPDGTYTVTARLLKDNTPAATTTSTFTVIHTNRAPVIATIVDHTVAESSALAFNVVVTDADNEIATITHTALPVGATFTDNRDNTATFAWTPGYQTAGTYTFGVTATDASGASDTKTATVIVTHANRAPTLANISSRTVAEASPLTFGVSATDPDNDITTISATGLPSGATLTDNRDNTATFAWTPGYDAAGSYTFGVTATDPSGASDTKTATVIVTNTNRAPIIASVPNQTIAQNSTLTLTLTGSDPDGDAVTWTLVNGPAGLTFDATTHTATWTPTFSQLGAYSAKFGLSDGTLSANVTVPIQVLFTPRAPSVASVTTTGVEESLTKLYVRATTLNADIVTLAATGLPAGATFTDLSNNTGLFTWTPGLGTASTTPYEVIVTATSMGLIGSAPFDIRVFQHSSLTIVAVQNGTTQTSPGKTVTLSATVTNTGPETDTFTLTTRDSNNWHPSTPAPVTLAPGASAVVNLTVTVPATSIADRVTLAAISVGNPTVGKGVLFDLAVTMRLTVVMDNNGTFLPTSAVTGKVIVSFGDGTLVKGATVRLTQTPKLLPAGGAQLASTISGTSDANGEYRFDYGTDAASRVPGDHTLVATGLLSFVTGTGSGVYTIGVPPGTTP